MTNQDRAEKIVREFYAIKPDEELIPQGNAAILARLITSQLDKAVREAEIEHCERCHEEGFASAREKAANIFHEHYPNEPVIEQAIRKMEAEK